MGIPAEWNRLVLYKAIRLPRFSRQALALLRFATLQARRWGYDCATKNLLEGI
jgi:hypothetical protein